MALPVVLLVVGIAAAIASAYLLRQKDTSVLRDDKQSTTATRGAFVPVVNGRAFVGPNVIWVGESFTKMESVSGGGKGGKRGQKQRIYYERAWHSLCVGPAFRLHRIRQNGETIFEGPIDSESHPSGSTIDTGKGGVFIIYWGESDQPINTFIGSIDRKPNIGVSSGWPFLCSVVWVEKRLGLAKQWALLDYEIECLPYGSTLVRTSSFQPASYTLNGTPRAVFAATDGGPGRAALATIVVDGRDVRREFPPGGKLKLSGNAAGNGDHGIFTSTYTKTQTTPFPPVERTTITLVDDLVGSNNAGTVEGYVQNPDDGVNPIHSLDSILRESYPHGLGGLGGALADLDSNSMEQGAQLMVTEGIVGHCVAEEGETALSVLSSILMDAGAVISLEHQSGLWRLVMVRKPTPPIPSIPADAILPPLPEIENNLGPKAADRAVFEFADREKNFRTNEITVDSDSQALREGYSTPRKITMEIPIKYSVAQKVAERRSLETNAHGNKYELKANRSTRLMMPGRAFVASGIGQVLRLVEKRIDPLTSEVTLIATTDAYGVRAQTFFPPSGSPGGDLPEDPVPDPESVVLEIDPPINRGDEPVVAVLRIRDNDRIRGADVWMSEDGITYVHVGTAYDAVTGGRLTEQLILKTDSMLETGPTFTLLGPDAGLIRDYSLDEPSWHRGRQLAVFANGEICCLRNVVALGGSSYRLMGLIRGRGPVGQKAHTVAEAVFILDPRTILPIKDAALDVNVTVYFKISPFTLESQGIPLGELPFIQVTIKGLGVAPMKPANLSTVNVTNSFGPGEDIPLTWNWRSPLARRSGAGEQGYGSPHAAAPIFGSFTLRIKDVFTGLVRGEISGIGAPPFTYTNALLQSHYGGEPSEMDLEIVNVANGFESAAATARVALD